MAQQLEERVVDLKSLSARDYNVILHNDDSIYSEVVVEAIVSVVNFSRKEALTIMLNAHRVGKALIITTNKSVAETYKQQLEEYGLTISLEKI